MINFKNVARASAMVTPFEDREGVAKAMEALMKAAYCEALLDYGIWKDGTQRIGCQDRRVQDIIKEIMHRGDSDVVAFDG